MTKLIVTNFHDMQKCSNQKTVQMVNIHNDCYDSFLLFNLLDIF